MQKQKTHFKTGQINFIPKSFKKQPTRCHETSKMILELDSDINFRIQFFRKKDFQITFLKNSSLRSLLNRFVHSFATVLWFSNWHTWSGVIVEFSYLMSTLCINQEGRNTVYEKHLLLDWVSLHVIKECEKIENRTWYWEP